MIRNILLFFRKIPAIQKPSQKTFIQKIVGDQTQLIPNILQQRYSNRTYSKEIILLNGEMNITISKSFNILSPLFRLAGALVPYPAEKIPVLVELVSNENSDMILMCRTLYYSDKTPYHFRSRIMHIKDNIVIELMRFGFGSKLIYNVDKDKIIMNYGGYVLRLGKWLIPIPLSYLIGKFEAYEQAISEDTFNMEVKLVHPIFGKIFQYDGYFKITTPHE
jgi:hypothetical protein